MPRKATRNTFGFENVAGVDVRRRVVAGKPIPDHYRVEEGTYEGEIGTGTRVVGETGEQVDPSMVVQSEGIKAPGISGTSASESDPEATGPEKEEDSESIEPEQTRRPGRRRTT